MLCRAAALESSNVTSSGASSSLDERHGPNNSARVTVSDGFAFETAFPRCFFTMLEVYL